MAFQFRRQLFHLLPLIIVSILSIHQSMIWPVLPAGFLASLLILLYDRTNFSLIQIAVESIVAGLLYRLTVLATAPSMIGMDPDKYAVAISLVSDEGVSVISGLGFYGSTPVYHLFHVTILEITNLDPATTLQLSAVVLYSTIPVAVAAYLAVRISGPEAAKLGSILAVSGSASIIYSFLTIPQGLMVIVWYLFAATLITNRNNSGRAALLILFIIIMAGLHKLGAILALGAIVSVISVIIIDILREKRQKVPNELVSYTLIAGLVFSIQMVWLTAWIKGVVSKFLYILGFETVTPSPIETPAATKIGGLDIVFFEHGAWISLLIAAGVAGAWLLYIRTDYESVGLLGIAGVSALAIVMAAATSFSLSLERAIALGEPFFIILIAVGVVSLSKRSNLPLAPAIMSLLIVTQLASAGAVPDHPTEIQEHLTTDEIEAKQWANTHIDQPIYGHYFVAQEITDFDGERATYRTGEGGGFPVGWTPATEFLITGNLSTTDGCFFLRKGQNKVRYNGLYRLDYDPVQQLEGSNRTKVMDNSDVAIYC